MGDWTLAVILICVIYVSSSLWISVPRRLVLLRRKDDDEEEDSKQERMQDEELTSTLVIAIKMKQFLDAFGQDFPFHELYKMIDCWKKEPITEWECNDNVVLEEDLRECLELACMAYETSLSERLARMGYSLLQHDTTAVSYYVAANTETKQAVVAIAGKTSFSEILSDVVATQQQQQQQNNNGGMLVAARSILPQIKVWIYDFFLPSRYKVLICGHSTGAGVACLLGTQLQHCRVVGFGTPSCASYETAMACCDRVTSVVNDSDVVPRLGAPAARDWCNISRDAYVPGRVVLLQNNSNNNSNNNNGVVVGNGTMAHLAHIPHDTKLLANHLPAAYEQTMRALKTRRTTRRRKFPWLPV